ncbi:hypothetical protein D3C72_2349470 [compost metagenome]
MASSAPEATLWLYSTVTTPLFPTVTDSTALPLISVAEAMPAEALVDGHSPLLAKYSAIAVFEPAASCSPSPTWARLV